MDLLFCLAQEATNTVELGHFVRPKFPLLKVILLVMKWNNAYLSTW